MVINTDIKRREYFRRYICGSAIYSESPQDIDIAIIYDKQYVSILEAIEYRNEITSILSNLNSTTIDAILLSKEEENEMEFLFNAKHIEF